MYSLNMLYIMFFFIMIEFFFLYFAIQLYAEFILGRVVDYHDHRLRVGVWVDCLGARVGISDIQEITIGGMASWHIDHHYLIVSTHQGIYHEFCIRIMCVRKRVLRRQGRYLPNIGAHKWHHLITTSKSPRNHTSSFIFHASNWHGFRCWFTHYHYEPTTFDVEVS